MDFVKISLNKPVVRILDRLQSFYPTLSKPEIFRLGLSKLYSEASYSNNIQLRPSTVKRYNKIIEETEKDNNSNRTKSFGSPQEAMKYLDTLGDENKD